MSVPRFIGNRLGDAAVLGVTVALWDHYGAAGLFFYFAFRSTAAGAWLARGQRGR